MEDPAYRVEVERRRGRGAVSNAGGRFEPMHREAFDDGWDLDEEASPFRPRSSSRSRARSSRGTILPTSRSTAPSTPIAAASTVAPTASHGRPMRTRASPQASISKPRSSPRRMPRSSWKGAPRARLRAEDHRARGQYRSLPAGRTALRITRSILEVLNRANHPVGIVTKSALVTRDIDILAQMADRQLAKGRLGHDARHQAPSRHGAPRGEPRQASRHHSQTLRGRHPGHGPRRADHPGHQRARDRGDPEGGLSGRSPRRRDVLCGSPTNSRISCGNGFWSIIRASFGTCSPSSSRATAARTTTLNGGRGRPGSVHSPG